MQAYVICMCRRVHKYKLRKPNKGDLCWPLGSFLARFAYPMSFTNLPAELYESIFNHVPSSDLQQTVLSVTRAIPLSPVPISSLFRSIRIAYPVQAIHLYRRLRVKKTDTGLSGNETAWVKEFSIESWSVDADVILNLVRLLPKLQTLNIWIGPENFTPEHLEELFLKPSFELKHLSLRFRP